MGSRFNRYLKNNPEQEREYKLEKRLDRKHNFRKAFAESQWKEFVTRKSYRRSFREVDITHGQYEPLSRVIQKEGGAQDCWGLFEGLAKWGLETCG